MSSNKIPVLRQQIRLVSEHRETRLNQAQLAQHHEENLGDLVQITEIRSDRFESLHSRMSQLYSAAVELNFQGFVALEVVVSLSRHWDELILEEIGNRNLRTTQVLRSGPQVLEAHFDNLETSFSAQADHFDLLLVTLIALRDELIRRNRANTSPTPLGDVDLG